MTIGCAEDLAALRRAGRVVAATLRAMRAAVRPGVTTRALDAVGAAVLRRHGAASAPQRDYGFPGWTCLSVNDEIVHGVPGARVLRPGDLLKIDVTAVVDGFVADAAVTVPVPPAPAEACALAACARAAFRNALHAARAGRPVRDLGRAVEEEVRRRGFHVIRWLTGHGVGRRIHEPPQVPNFPDPASHAVLHEGLVIALEPIVATSPARAVEAADKWTLRTHDGGWAAHHEHTIVIRRGPPLILTA